MTKFPKDCQDRFPKWFQDDRWIFWSRFFRNPKAIGAIAPSSKQLGRFLAHTVLQTKPDIIIEIGAGTGRLTQNLLQSGIQPHQIWVVEMDLHLVKFLKKKFPELNVIHGNAMDLLSLLPQQILGHVDVIMSGVPLVNLSFQEQARLFYACFQSMKKGGRVIQFSYSPKSPIPSKRLGVVATRIGHVFCNLPPATIWAFQSTG
jgi:phosphatidylethanolamine/phosphatidyl-N-methylethanolamine N-methyltransferase